MIRNCIFCKSFGNLGSWICKECIQNAFFPESRGVGFKIQDSRLRKKLLQSHPLGFKNSFWDLESWILPPWIQEVFSEPGILNLESYPLGFKKFFLSLESWILNPTPLDSRILFGILNPTSLDSRSFFWALNLESWILPPWIQELSWNLESWILNPTSLDSRRFFWALNPESWIQRGWIEEVFPEPWILNPKRLDWRSFFWALNLEYWIQILGIILVTRNCNFVQMIGLSAKDIPQINLLTLWKKILKHIILSLLSKQTNQLWQT